jgi:hypothetical protein
MFNIGGDGDYGGPSATTEVLRNYRWAAIQIGPIQANLKMLKDLQLPDLELTIQEIQGAQLTYKYAKGVKWADAQIVFYDDGSILDELIEWKKKIYSSGTGIKSHQPNLGYKQDCKFILLDGCRNEVNSVRLKNAFPRQIQSGKLSYSDTNLKVVNVTLTYDWAEFEGIKDNDSDDDY